MYYLELAKQGQMPTAPVADLLGFRATDFRVGEVTLEYEAQTEHTNPAGLVQGGIITTVADAAMASAYLTTLNQGEFYTTIEVKVNFLRPVRQGILRFVGKTLRSGGKIGLAQCEVFDAAGNLVAFATSTCMTLHAEK